MDAGAVVLVVMGHVSSPLPCLASVCAVQSSMTASAVQSDCLCRSAVARTWNLTGSAVRKHVRHALARPAAFRNKECSSFASAGTCTCMSNLAVSFFFSSSSPSSRRSFKFVLLLVAHVGAVVFVPEGVGQSVSAALGRLLLLSVLHRISRDVNAPMPTVRRESF